MVPDCVPGVMDATGVLSLRIQRFVLMMPQELAAHCVCVCGGGIRTHA